MTDEVIQQTGADETILAQESEAEVIETEVKEGAADATEQVAETDEQKNERVRQESAAKAAKRSQGVQKRMDELTANKYAAERRADELAKQNAELVRAVLASKGGGTAAVTEAQGEPKPESYTDYNEYVKALAIFHATQASTVKVEEQTKAFDEANRRREAAAAQRERGAKYAEGVRAAQTKYPDYAEVMEDAASVSVPQSVVDLLFSMGSDGADITYHLTKNPALATQFDGQPAYMHGVLLGQIAATLKGTAKASNAPPPGKGVLAKPGPGTAPPEDPDAYMAWAAKNMR